MLVGYLILAVILLISILLFIITFMISKDVSKSLEGMIYVEIKSSDRVFHGWVLRNEVVFMRNADKGNLRWAVTVSRYKTVSSVPCEKILSIVEIKKPLVIALKSRFGR